MMAKKKTIEENTIIEEKKITFDRNVYHKDILYIKWETYTIKEEDYEILCKFSTWKCEECACE